MGGGMGRGPFSASWLNAPSATGPERGGHRRHPVTAAAIKLGRVVARERSVSFAGLFRDTLPGDLARLEVLRRLRKQFPESTSTERDDAIREGLTP